VSEVKIIDGRTEFDDQSSYMGGGSAYNDTESRGGIIRMDSEDSSQYFVRGLDRASSQWDESS
jgi:hypothetical protein